jgi:biopolymer transport protein ExbD
MAAPDIAFILIVFFLVCASVQPDTGMPQVLPRTEEQPDPASPSQTLEVSITKGAVVLNGEMVAVHEVGPRVRALLRGARSEEDRIVVVKSSDDTPFERWIDVTASIGSAGGTITLQLEETQTLTID